MSNDFLEKLKELDTLKLPQKDYAIVGSGPMAIRNMRQANDIDIIVRMCLWNDLKDRYELCDKKHMKIGNIEIWKEFINLTPKIDFMIDSAEFIEGYSFVSLEDTLSWKEHLNRKKDQEDIILIKNFLYKNYQEEV